jgi:hypothetical protein
MPDSIFVIIGTEDSMCERWLHNFAKRYLDEISNLIRNFAKYLLNVAEIWRREISYVLRHFAKFRNKSECAPSFDFFFLHHGSFCFSISQGEKRSQKSRIRMRTYWRLFISF